MDETCERHGITSAQYNVLRILRGVYPDGHPRCEIITRMIHVAPDVTRLIDRLEKLDLVERSKSEQDLRLSLSVITQKGLDLLVSIQPEIDALEEQLSKGLTVQEAGLLADLCDKVTSAIEESASVAATVTSNAPACARSYHTRGTVPATTCCAEALVVPVAVTPEIVGAALSTITLVVTAGIAVPATSVAVSVTV